MPIGLDLCFPIYEGCLPNRPLELLSEVVKVPVILAKLRFERLPADWNTTGLGDAAKPLGQPAIDIDSDGGTKRRCRRSDETAWEQRD